MAQDILVDRLQSPELFDHLVTKFEVIETHISWVLLTGEYAYKIKKPVNFGFLDFSTLEKRHLYCREELRLNRRLAPQLYLDVVSIHGSVAHPEFNSHAPVIEYAVKMQQFPQSTQLDRILEENGLDNLIMDKLADKVAHFHLLIDLAKDESDFGDLDHVRQPVLENFKHIRTSIDDIRISQQLNKLEQWSKQQLLELKGAINQRKIQGFVRECHGDMHLRNIALWNDEIIIFDCIEFNKNFYWIDVISDMAFLVMDLEDRHQDILAQHFLNQYLEITGDYEGLSLLRFYKVYRALVRAKVGALRIGQEQPDSQEYAQTYKGFIQYLELAERYIKPAIPCLLINHGISGSGKTFFSRRIMQKYPAIHVRSDVERKRLFRIAEGSDSTAAIGEDLYRPEATQKTYARLLEIAKSLLMAGYSVLIDATNLKMQQRLPFIELAQSLRMSCFILDFHASIETLSRRVKQRSLEGKDMSDATLDIMQHQFTNYEPLSHDEQPFIIDIDTDSDINIDDIVERIRAGHLT